MNVLIVHQNFPGQFPHIVTALLARGDRVAAIGGPTSTSRPSVDLRRWQLKRGTTTGLFEPATRAEADLIRADAAAHVAAQLKRDGFVPDVIVGHPGWGETLHLKEVWPEARLILFGEWFYTAHGGDTGFDPEFGQQSFADMLRVNAKNATQTLAYVLADRVLTPTRFQASRFPPSLRDGMTIMHEGIDLSRATRKPDARLRLPDGRRLDATTPIVTYAARTLEPLRGFHVVMRALPDFLDACPEAQVVIIGKDEERGYGAAAAGARTWKAAMLAELGERLDLGRVHFLGHVPHATLVDAFSVGRAHIYYTYPFVLSWSLVEAMACESLVVASDTPPVRDAVTDGEDGLLLDFFDTAALSATLVRAVREPEAFAGLRVAARRTALERFAKERGVAAWLAAIDELA